MAVKTVSATALPGSNSTVSAGVAGVAITQGQYIYIAADGTLKLADSDASSPANGVNGVYLALNTAAIGQVCNYVSRGAAVIPGFATVANDLYLLSNTAGSACGAISDLTAGSLLVVLGCCGTAGAAGTGTMSFNPTVGVTVTT